jgi:ribose-phosphate pyrophosphokinase
MIRIDTGHWKTTVQIKPEHYPDGSLKIALPEFPFEEEIHITWMYQNEEELLALIYVVNHIRNYICGNKTKIYLKMPYVPNARMDRIKDPTTEVFTLKYFADIINSLNFEEVEVLDPHSNVSAALINNIRVQNPKHLIDGTIEKIHKDFAFNIEELLIFYPDEGSMKRYSNLLNMPYVFGIKCRDWKTGEILGLEVKGNIEDIKGKNVLIVDDICSKGGTFYHSAKKLKELGANKVFLYVSHCEDSLYDGELLKTDYVDHIYTTNSLLTRLTDEKITVFIIL